MSAGRILEHYQMRLQREFLYRAGKQHLGQEHCQSRQKEAMEFHYNAALTTLNIAKSPHFGCRCRKANAERSP